MTKPNETPRMEKRFLCWLFGHDWQPILDPPEIRDEIERWKQRGTLLNDLRMAKCGRCGTKEKP